MLIWWFINGSNINRFCMRVVSKGFRDVYMRYSFDRNQYSFLIQSTITSLNCSLQRMTTATALLGSCPRFFTGSFRKPRSIVCRLYPEVEANMHASFFLRNLFHCGGVFLEQVSRHHSRKLTVTTWKMSYGRFPGRP